MARALSLAHLTVVEAEPAEVIAIAAECGYGSVSLRLNSPRSDAPHPVLADAAAMRELSARMRATGVRLFDIEAFILRPETPFERYRRVLEAGAGLGARRALVVGQDDDESRLADSLARFGAEARDHGCGIDLEFMVFSAVKTLAQAARLVARAGVADAGVVVNALHLQRSGSGPADVAALDPALFHYLQLSDAPARIEDDRIVEEARNERLMPGEGALPLRDLVAAMPPAIPIALEIPSESLRRRGLSALDRARRARESYEAIFGLR